MHDQLNVIDSNFWWWTWVFGFAHYYYKSNSVDDIYKFCWMSVSSLKPANKRPSGKKKDLVEVSFRTSITLLDNIARVMSINAP